MQYEIRPITPDEFAQFKRASDAPFGWHGTPEDEEASRSVFEFDRSLAAWDNGAIVGTAGAFSFDLTLPGLTTLPVAGVSWVGVLPTHRRQGILRAMMQRQLDDVQARGEAIAVLTASESVIYGRFGYGVATSTVAIEIEKQHASFARQWECPGRVALIDHEEALRVLPAFYDQVRRRQPGALSRSDRRWATYLRNPQASAEGGARFYVTYSSPSGQLEGAAHYRVKANWEHALPENTLAVRELLALTPEANAALWQYCFSADLIRTVQAVNRPPDEPLRWMLADSRRLRASRLVDDLWVRLLDIPAALAARRYATEGRIVLDVTDPFRPQNTGRYLVEGGPDGAQCRPTTENADLVLDVDDLGAAYLGGVGFGALAWAGRIAEQTPGALRRADALFVTEPLPWCATPF